MLTFIKLFQRLVKVNNWTLFLYSAVLIIASSFLIYWLEPEKYENAFNGFWWVMTTVTTVGYGDFYPETVKGKFLGIFLYVFGISLISIVISKVIDGLLGFRKRKEEGKLPYYGKKHFVMIGWNTHAEYALQEIMSSDESAEIVIIDQIGKTPVQHERVHYVQGNPIQKNVLEQANLQEARAVFIFANEVTNHDNVIRDTSFIDGKTLLVATAIEQYFSHIYTVVEIKDKANVGNFAHVKVDEFIISAEAISHLAVRAAMSPGAAKILGQLLSSQSGDDLFAIRTRSEWKTYRDAFMALLKEGATLLSDGERLDINRRLDDTIPQNARLFVVCNKETLKRLL
ncbi:potassium channel protein [Paenibacillus turpanensis]|uniref:potassium channel protein n=1 Tax=Paenibacillus turpanensis TaxID=2689078 RepID=UPI00140D4BDF|nr:potassium channel protein [Paenibacillus turpanensis]